MARIEFQEKYLEELWISGKAKNKKYRFPEDIIKRYIKTINILRGISCAEDFYQLNSLNYKKLVGNSLESIRINNKYRLEFRTMNNAQVIEVCLIIKLSNHYE